MSDPTTLRKHRDHAYGCFLLIGATALLGSLGSLLPADIVEPAYFGFFVLIPLALASAVALLAVTVLALIVGRADPVLIALLVITGTVVTFAIAVFSDILPVRIDGLATDFVIAAYGMATLWICIHWFAARRNRHA
jgi:hypothetical protein